MAKGDKFDEEKTRWDCIPWSEIEGIAKVMTYGAKKYNEDPDDPNWIKVKKGKHRYFAAMMRHFMLDLNGEVIDPDSGLSHLDHFKFNALAYARFKRLENEGNGEY